MSKQTELSRPVVPQAQSSSTSMASSRGSETNRASTSAFHERRSKSPSSSSSSADEQAYWKRKREIALQLDEISLQQKKLMLELQTGIVLSTLNKDFENSDKLRDCMIVFTSPAKDKEVVFTSKDQEQDVKFNIERRYASPPPLLSSNSASTTSRVDASDDSRVKLEDELVLLSSIQNEFASLAADKLVVHVVTANNPMPLTSKHMKVMYKVKKENGNHRYGPGNVKCNIDRTHFHHLAYVPKSNSTQLLA
jgi:hypothetical protein